MVQQLKRQDQALAARRLLNSRAVAGQVARLPGSTNQHVVQQSDGSLVPSYDHSASEASVGKAVQVQDGLIRTKVGSSGL